MQPSAVRNGLVGIDEDDVLVVVAEAERQDFRLEGSDLARREVDHGADLATDQVGRAVVLRDLGRARFVTDLGAEIDDEFQRRFARFGEGFGGYGCRPSRIERW